LDSLDANSAARPDEAKLTEMVPCFDLMHALGIGRLEGRISVGALGRSGSMQNVPIAAVASFLYSIDRHKPVMSLNLEDRKTSFTG
jgi:hypothetical protein